VVYSLGLSLYYLFVSLEQVIVSEMAECGLLYGRWLLRVQQPDGASKRNHHQHDFLSFETVGNWGRRCGRRHKTVHHRRMESTTDENCNNTKIVYNIIIIIFFVCLRVSERKFDLTISLLDLAVASDGENKQPNKQATIRAGISWLSASQSIESNQIKSTMPPLETTPLVPVSTEAVPLYAPAKASAKLLEVRTVYVFLLGSRTTLATATTTKKKKTTRTNRRRKAVWNAIRARATLACVAVPSASSRWPIPRSFPQSPLLPFFSSGVSSFRSRRRSAIVAVSYSN